MKKTTIALSVFAALAGAAFADDALTVYGKINVSVQAVDEANGDNFSEIKSNASRFGIKGKAKLNDGLEAFYKLEWEVDVTDKSKSSQDHLKSRNQVVGLKGGFGTVFVGRHDTPMKKAQKKIDLFNDYEGDIKHVINGENRESNILQYSTPKIGGALQFNIAMIPGEDPANGQDSLTDATSFSVTYNKNDLYLALAQDTDVDGEGVDTTRIVGQYNMDKFQFGLLWETTDNGTTDADGFVLSGAMKMSGGNTLKLQYADSDIWQLGVSAKTKYSTMTSLGLDHKLSKKTKVFVWYTDGELGATGDNDTFFAVGVEHKF
ncbi:MAG: porin [Gammaproteobacteria bacterium]|nr:MAG: porin [Gammaproteobacteria bacterium]